MPDETNKAEVKQADLDDLLNASLEAALKNQPPPPPPARELTLFPGPPTGVGVPPKPEAPPAKPKSLASMGISRGGVVRNASTVHRTQLDNPVNNPRPNTPAGAKTAKASAIDQNDLPPEFGIPGTIMTGMDANLEERAKERIEEAQNPITMQSSLADLLQRAVAKGGTWRFATPRFILEITITA
jgi:hypothetical protein